MKYVLSWSKGENESHIEKYHSFFKWLKRIIQLLYKEDTSVLIYKPLGGDSMTGDKTND